MAWSQIANLAAELGINGGTSAAINTTGANLIVVAVTRYDPSGQPTLSDSKGNTWVGLTSTTLTTGALRLFYCYAPTVGTGHTFTTTLSTSYSSVHVAAFSGAAASPLDGETADTTGSAIGRPGSITPTVDGDLIISAVVHATGSTPWAIDSGMTILNSQAGTSGQGFSGAIAYKVQTTAAAINPQWTISSGNVGTPAIAAFKAAVVAAPVLTGPTGTQTGATTATIGVTTDVANGVLYAVVTTSATQPSIAQIKAGQNNGGTAAAYASSQTITTTGAKTFSATGLTASTAYYAHFVHTDASSTDSNRSTSSSFTTAAVPRTATITLTSDGTTPRASLSSLKWAWFDQVTPDLFVAPTDKGAVESTDASGVLVLSLPNSALSIGAVGWLTITDSDGTTSQSPSAKAFSGPVTVA